MDTVKKKEVREELELCVRSVVEAVERSQQEGIDPFDELRILEAAFNRLFLAVEHMCNALVLLETGNYSRKHFGNIKKLKELAERYRVPIAELYQTRSALMPTIGNIPR